MARSGWWPALLALALATPAAADPDRGAFPLEDRLQVIVLQRSVLAIDGRTGGQREEPLELGERVLSHRADGRVAIALTDRRILAIAAGSGAFQEARFVRGESLARRAMFFSTGQRQCSDLAARLGCQFTSKGAVRTDRSEGTGIAGLYVAGDASRDVQLAIIAAAEGARAAFAINTALQELEGKRVASGAG